ncbi:unnamed protein product, partial [Mycena citricolor]
FNQPVVDRYFDVLAGTLDEHEIPVENIYNMDEKGCQRGGGKKSARVKYFYSRRQRAKYRHRSANLELITILEAVCADGSTLKPGFVFPGVEHCPEWFNENQNIHVSMSPNGWTDNEIFIEWLRDCFIPQAKDHAK